MQRQRFSTSIAFIPWNYRRSTRDVASLFSSTPPGLLSLCVHGCDHIDGGIRDDRCRLAPRARGYRARADAIAPPPFRGSVRRCDGVPARPLFGRSRIGAQGVRLPRDRQRRCVARERAGYRDPAGPAGGGEHEVRGLSAVRPPLPARPRRVRVRPLRGKAGPGGRASRIFSRRLRSAVRVRRAAARSRPAPRMDEPFDDLLDSLTDTHGIRRQSACAVLHEPIPDAEQHHPHSKVHASSDGMRTRLPCRP